MAKLTDKEIIKALKDGKKVKCINWVNSYLEADNKTGRLTVVAWLDVPDIEADDWEVAE